MLSVLDKAPERERGALEQSGGPAAEFEMVVGRRQVASWLFLITLIVGAASTLAFMAGKMTAPASARIVTDTGGIQSPAAVIPARATHPPPVVSPSQIPSESTSSAANPAAPAVTAPLPQATILNAPFAASHKPATEAEPPLFQEPKRGAVYLQMGAVDHGMAMILAEGLRKHGFDASVAPGPSEKIFRVLIGPLPDPQAFTRAKAEVDSMELGTFARRYQK